MSTKCEHPQHRELNKLNSQTLTEHTISRVVVLTTPVQFICVDCLLRDAQITQNQCISMVSLLHLASERYLQQQEAKSAPTHQLQITGAKRQQLEQLLAELESEVMVCRLELKEVMAN